MTGRQKICRAVVLTCLGLVVFIPSVDVVVHPAAFADTMGLDKGVWIPRLTAGGATVAALPLIAAAVILSRRQFRRLRLLRLLATHQRGTVAVEFLLVLPILILLFGTVIQMALLAHAQLVLGYASYASARSAMIVNDPTTLAVHLDDGLPSAYRMPTSDAERARQAAVAVLAALQSSPYTPAVSGSSAPPAALVQWLSSSHPAWPGEDYYTHNYTNAWARTQVDVQAGLMPLISAQALVGMLRELELRLLDLPNAIGGSSGGSGGLGPIAPLVNQLRQAVASLAARVAAAAVGPIRRLTGYAQRFADKLKNPLAPTEVQVQVDYACPLRMPSLLWMIYYDSDDVKRFGCPVIRMSRSLRLQSSGARVDVPPILPLWEATPLPGEGHNR